MAVKEAAPRSRRINHPSRIVSQPPVIVPARVGTRAFIFLMAGRDAHDPLFLQVKEATASVFEGYLPKSRYRQHGERVVQGQRLMQAAGDIFLGWTKGLDTSRNFYWRHLRDTKGSALVELMAPITDFCERYADQNEQDYEEFGKAIRSGRLEAFEGV